MFLESLTIQHASLLALSSSLEGLVAEGDPRKEALPAAKAVGHLGEEFLRHAAVEDTRLYTRLLGSDDPRVRDFAKAFADDLDELRRVISEFARKWSAPEAIGQAPTAFAEEAQPLLARLHDRIEREELELFPLLGPTEI